MTENDCLPELHRVLLRGLLLHVKKILDKFNTKYWLDGGSLLGCVRNNKIIDWDDDIDIGILDFEFTSLGNLLQNEINPTITVENEKGEKTLYPIKFEIAEPNALMKIYVPDLWVENTITRKIYATPTLDIFSYKKSGKKVKLSSHHHRVQFSDCWYFKDELLPLQKVEFEGIECTIANNPLGYLHRYYGSNCVTTIQKDIRLVDNPQLKDRNTTT